METASAAGQPDPENYCIQLLMVPQEQQATDIGNDPTDDSFLLPGPDDGMNPPMDNGGMEPPMGEGMPVPDPEEDEEPIPGQMSEDSFKGYTQVLNDIVKVSVARKAKFENSKFQSAFIYSEYAKNPLRLAVQDIQTSQVAVFEGYCGTVLSAAHNWANGDYLILKAAFDEKNELDVVDLPLLSADYTEGEYIVGTLGTVASRVGGIARGAKSLLGKGSAPAASAGQNVVKTAQEVLTSFMRMGIKPIDQVRVMVRGVQGQSQNFMGVAQQVAMQIQQFSARTGGVIIERASRVSAVAGRGSAAVQGGSPAPGGTRFEEGKSEGKTMTTPTKEEVLNKRIEELEARLAVSEYTEKVKELTSIPGTVEELAKQLVVLQTNVGETAVTEQLRSWQAEQSNADSAQFGESILESVGGIQASSFDEFVGKYMEAHPEATRREAFLKVGKEHPELREYEV